MLDNTQIQKLLDTEGKSIIAEIRALIISTGAKASGKTGKSLEYIVNLQNTKINFQITGADSFNYIEVGRGPSTKGGKKGRLQKIIRQWIDDKGISPDGNMTKDSLAYIITRAIHQRGTLLHLLNEVREIQSAVLTNRRIDKIGSGLGDIIARDAGQQIISAFKI